MLYWYYFILYLFVTYNTSRKLFQDAHKLIQHDNFTSNIARQQGKYMSRFRIRWYYTDICQILSKNLISIAETCKYIRKAHNDVCYIFNKVTWTNYLIYYLLTSNVVIWQETVSPANKPPCIKTYAHGASLSSQMLPWRKLAVDGACLKSIEQSSPPYLGLHLQTPWMQSKLINQTITNCVIWFERSSESKL